jgi:hypothetical protein
VSGSDFLFPGGAKMPTVIGARNKRKRLQEAFEKPGRRIPEARPKAAELERQARVREADEWMERVKARKGTP